MPSFRKPRQSLRQGLDRDVYQIVKKLEDERSQQNPPKNGITKKRKPFAVDDIYEIIKKSNSSLSRQKRKPLEDAIERVLEFHKQETEDSDSEADVEVEENKSNKPEDRFLLNRQMVKHWGSASSAVPTAQGADGKSVKKRRLSQEPEANGTEAVSDASVMTGARTPKTNGASAEGQPASKKAPKPSKYGPEETQGAIVLGGAEPILEQMDEVIFHRLHQSKGNHGYSDLPVGFIVAGPPGTGKQSLVRNLAAGSSTPIVPLGRYLKDVSRTPEKVAKIITDSLDEAKRCAPCVVLIERLHDFVAKAGSGQNDMAIEIAAQLEVGMRRLREWESDGNNPVVIVATTSKPDLIDTSLKRPDLFALTINVRVPDAKDREEIFRVWTRNLELATTFDFKALAMRTHGFVGEDIRTVSQMAMVRAMARLSAMERGRARRVLREAGELPAEGEDEPLPTWERNALRRREFYDYQAHPSYTSPEPVHVTEQDFLAAAAEHTPYMRREGFSEIPSTSWSEVGALHSVRAAFQVSIVRPIKEPLLFKKFGKQRPAGVLLFGPPGCGKTLVAKAVANDAQASFILVKGPELLNKYVGESERSIRELFTRAKSCAPCILFFDEMDSLVPKRENTTTEAGARVVNALLAELDGAGDRGEVYVIGTSNRPDMIDPAVLRPGRLDKLLFVDLPTEDERVDILRTIYRNGMGASDQHAVPASGEDAEMSGQESSGTGTDAIEAIARDPRCKGFSGADLYGLYNNAVEACMLRWEGGDPLLSKDDWEAALNKTKPSVSNPETYRRLAAKLHHQ